MNGYAIVTRETAREVAEDLRERGMADAPVRVAERGQGPAALEEAARVPADLLVLDVDAGPGLGPAVLRYRLARQETRVVLLAVGRKPGDAEVAQVVQAGVYDVVTEKEALGAVLDRPPATLAEAALWLDPGLAPQAAKVEVRERVVVEHRPVGTVTVAVAGAAPGVGCTHTALAISAFLARRGFSVALVEANAHPGLRVLGEIMGARQGRVPDSIHVAGVDVLPAPDQETGLRTYERLLLSVRRGYEYIILDLGVPGEPAAREMNRADLPVLVASASPWRWADLYPMRSPDVPSWPAVWRLALAAPAEHAAKQLATETGYEATAIPYMPDPLADHEAGGEVLAGLLAPVLPQVAGRKARFWARLRRRG